MRRCPQRLRPRASNAAAAAGLAFERKLVRELATTATTLGGLLEHNPWFEYKLRANSDWGQSVPDAILSLGRFVIVIEAKLTYVPDAREKLTKVYIPLVRAGLCAVPGTVVAGLVVVKNLTPDSGRRAERLSDAFDGKAEIPVLHWRGNTTIVW